jgi:hypothetical protein
VTPIDPDERTLEAWLLDAAAPIPPEVVEASLRVIGTTPQQRRGWTAWAQVEVHRLVGIAAAVVLATVASAALLRTSQPTFVPGSAPGSPTGFAGVWVTIDCAQWWQGDRVDCSVWGDSSQLRMMIGEGEAPLASYEDSSARCSVRSGGPDRFVPDGIGTHERPYLWLALATNGCPSFGNDGDGRLQLYRDPGSDTLWEDEDGDDWALIWRRAP